MSAPWAARSGHSTVIDAAGAIYVIGGSHYVTDFNDVWASTDGGAQPGPAPRVGAGYWAGTQGVLGGTMGYYMSITMLLKGYSRGATGSLWGTMGYSRGT